LCGLAIGILIRYFRVLIVAIWVSLVKGAGYFFLGNGSLVGHELGGIFREADVGLELKIDQITSCI